MDTRISEMIKESVFNHLKVDGKATQEKTSNFLFRIILASITKVSFIKLVAVQKLNIISS